MFVRENLQEIRSQVEHRCKMVNRDSSEVKIIAVTKNVGLDRTKEAITEGIQHIAENREDGFQKKWESFSNQAQFHFIGSLQTRKVKGIINKIDYLHSLDRTSLAKEIEKRAEKTIKCFVQVNVSGEDSKHGLQPNQVLSFIQDIEQYKSILVVGLMTMAPFTDDESVIRKCFSSLRKLKEEVQALNYSYAPCTELSMGMSNDYTIAIEEGSTFIRIGTSLVGKEF
ncbi:YggS family pyridoxal phosphate-dependent enzyme [Bacillus timonensis]|nr:YggS family pyridoxal phosphate-dependent enzyme [Bacillus timonensis]